MHFLVANCVLSGHFVEHQGFKRKGRLDYASYEINDLYFRYLIERKTVFYNNLTTKISIQYLPYWTQPNQLKIADFCLST